MYMYIYIYKYIYTYIFMQMNSVGERARCFFTASSTYSRFHTPFSLSV